MIYNVVSILDNIMGSFNRYSPFAYLGALFVLQVLCDSILDKFNPISKGTISFLMFVTISSFARTKSGYSVVK